MLLLMLLGFFLFAFFTASLANMTGIEGGMIFVPLLVLLFGLSPQEAAGVSLATMVFGLGAGSLAYARQRRIDFGLGLVLFGVSMPGIVIGALLTPYLPAVALEVLLGLLLIPLGFLMIFRRNLGKSQFSMQKSPENWKRRLVDREGKQFRYSVRRLPIGLLVYSLTGFVAGLSGIGGGAIRVPTLILLLELPAHIAVATSVFTMALTALTGGLTHGFIGNVLPEYLLYLVPGVLLGSQVGAWLCKRTSATLLNRLLGWFVILIGFIILVKAIGL